MSDFYYLKSHPSVPVLMCQSPENHIRYVTATPVGVDPSRPRPCANRTWNADMGLILIGREAKTGTYLLIPLVCDLTLHIVTE